MAPHVAAIAAMSENRIIGKEGGLPWHIPEDLKRFKELTTGHTVLMGRETYDSLPPKFKPLPNRVNLVASRSATFPDGVRPVRDAAQFVQDFINGKEKLITDTLWIVGGAKIYEALLPFYDEIYLTRVHHSVEGDASFPIFEDRYQETSAEKHDGFTFLVYHRIIPV